jgi:hypothetical protein
MISETLFSSLLWWKPLSFLILFQSSLPATEPSSAVTFPASLSHPVEEDWNLFLRTLPILKNWELLQFWEMEEIVPLEEEEEEEEE